MAFWWTLKDEFKESIKNLKTIEVYLEVSTYWVQNKSYIKQHIYIYSWYIYIVSQFHSILFYSKASL